MSRSVRNVNSANRPWWRPPDKMSPEEMRKQVIAIVFMVVAVWLGSMWFLSDMSGEYSAYVPRFGMVKMSVIRRPTSMKSELSCGPGAILVTEENPANAGDQLSWVYKTPDEWVQQGQKMRRVAFHGKIENGIVTGTLGEGPSNLSITLQRNGLMSVIKLIQSFTPWG